MTVDVVVLPSLSEIEAAALAKAERIIAAGLQSFVEVGEALAAVRDQRLYRAEFGTFEAYCDAKWGLSRRRAYELVDASAAVKALCAMAHKSPVPVNERQARALTGLPPDVAADVMRKAHADTGGRVTAKAIEEARKMRDLANAIDASTTTKRATDLAKPDGRKQAATKKAVRKHVDLIDALTISLAGIVIGTGEVKELDRSVTAEEATRLTGDLSAQISELNRINRLLRERIK